MMTICSYTILILHMSRITHVPSNQYCSCDKLRTRKIAVKKHVARSPFWGAASEKHLHVGLGENKIIIGPSITPPAEHIPVCVTSAIYNNKLNGKFPFTRTELIAAGA